MDMFHLYLLCEHGGSAHVMYRDNAPRRYDAPVPKAWLGKLLPGIRYTLCFLKVAGIFVKGIGAIADVGEAAVKHLEFVGGYCACLVVFVVFVLSCYSRRRRFLVVVAR